MQGDTNRDLILQLNLALSRVIEAKAFHGYRRQLDKTSIQLSSEELKSFKIVTEELDLNHLDNALSTILKTDYLAT